MKVPSGIVDRDFLEHEPLKTKFVSWRLQLQMSSKRGAEPEDSWYDAWVHELRSGIAGEALESAQTWLRLAFAHGIDDSPGDEFPLHGANLKDFLQFHWLLFSREQDDAILFLNQRRRDLGFANHVSDQGQLLIQHPGTHNLRKTRRHIKPRSCGPNKRHGEKVVDRIKRNKCNATGNKQCTSINNTPQSVPKEPSNTNVGGCSRDETEDMLRSDSDPRPSAASGDILEAPGSKQVNHGSIIAPKQRKRKRMERESPVDVAITQQSLQISGSSDSSSVVVPDPIAPPIRIEPSQSAQLSSQAEYSHSTGHRSSTPSQDGGPLGQLIREQTKTMKKISSPQPGVYSGVGRSTSSKRKSFRETSLSLQQAPVGSGPHSAKVPRRHDVTTHANEDRRIEHIVPSQAHLWNHSRSGLSTQAVESHILPFVNSIRAREDHSIATQESFPSSASRVSRPAPTAECPREITGEHLLLSTSEWANAPSSTGLLSAVRPVPNTRSMFQPMATPSDSSIPQVFGPGANEISRAFMHAAPIPPTESRGWWDDKIPGIPASMNHLLVAPNPCASEVGMVPSSNYMQHFSASSYGRADDRDSGTLAVRSRFESTNMSGDEMPLAAVESLSRMPQDFGCSHPPLQDMNQLHIAENEVAAPINPQLIDAVDWTSVNHEFDIPEAEDDPLDAFIESTDLKEQFSDELFPPLCAPKLPLPRKPPIWAQSRQEVCETFDWFRSYQGGVYFANDIAKGYLLSAFSSSRDLFHQKGKLIISHGGGRAQSIHKERGQFKLQQASDQLGGDKSVRALLKNFEDQRPLVLLADDRYSLFPFDLSTPGYTYVVLGFYTIIHAWAEYQEGRNGEGRVVRFKFAFQWCERQGCPWWLEKEDDTKLSCLPKGIPSNSTSQCSSVMPLDPPSANAPPLHQKSRPAKVSVWTSLADKSSTVSNIYLKCSTCEKKSPRVYRQAWMCLSSTCPLFWKLEDGSEPSANLVYSPDFLHLLPLPPLALSPRDLQPRVPGVPRAGGDVTTYAFTRGFHCTSCGRMTSRFKWERWECLNCSAFYAVSGSIRPASDFWNQLPEYSSKSELTVAKDSGIKKAEFMTKQINDIRLNCQSYILPEERGRIHVIQTSARHNLEANEIFRQYQEQAATGELQFRRWPMRNNLASMYFLHHDGSNSFWLRPFTVRGPLLANYFSQNSGEPYHYVAGTENTTPFDRAPGAVLSALELIHKRAKEALDLNVNFNEILSAAYMERQKMSFHSDAEKGLGPIVASLSLGSAAYMHFRLRSKYVSPNNSKSRVVLSLILRHGDVVVMEGAQIQECYEHTVVPVNFRIAATARYIDSAVH